VRHTTVVTKWIQVQARWLDNLGTPRLVAMTELRGDASGLTSSELRLLPLLTTQLSLNEIAQILEMPRDVVMALAHSIYAKLGPLGESASRLTAP
jgi:ATP/maltotriose-dependent transcriptional regulator MalT